MQAAQEVINALGAISKARYLAMDYNGDWYAYTAKPKISSFCWDSSFSQQGYIGGMFNIQPAENWEESLVEYQPNPEIKIQEFGKKI